MKNTYPDFLNLFKAFCKEINLKEKHAQEMMVKFDLQFDYIEAYGDNEQDLGLAYEYYKNTVIPHKVAVFNEGMKMKNAFKIQREEKLITQLRDHDLSKFSFNEFAYARVDFKNYKDNPAWVLEDFKKAWHHHKSVNPHHPEYWFDVKKDGTTKPIKIPTNFISEMVADWRGAGITYNNPLKNWLNSNLSQFRFHKETVLELAVILARYCDISTEIADEKGEFLRCSDGV